MLKITRFDTPEDFLEITGEPLYKNEVVNSLMLGIVERLLDDPHYFGTDPYLGLVRDGENPVLAGTMTPPFGLLISALSEDAMAAMPLLAEDLVVGDVVAERRHRGAADRAIRPAERPAEL